jgi:hypothetical protein
MDVRSEFLDRGPMSGLDNAKVNAALATATPLAA